MIRKDMRKEKKPVRRIKDYDAAHFKAAMLEYEESSSDKVSEAIGADDTAASDDALPGTPPGDCLTGEEASPPTAVLPIDEGKEDSGAAAPPDAPPSTPVSQPKQEEQQLTAGKEIPDSASPADDAPPKSTVFYHSKTDKGVHARIPLLTKDDRKRRLKEIQNALPELNMPSISDLICVKLRIVKHNGKLYYYDKHCYQKLTVERFKKVATDYLPLKLLKKLSTMQIFDQSFEYLYIRMLDEPDEESIDDWISFENGDFNATTGEFCPHSPDHLTFFYIHARFDSNDTSCPHMDDLLASMTDADEVSIRLVWFMLAYLMLDTPPHRVFFYLGPAPASGKSLLGNIIDLLFGEGSCYHAEVDSLSQRFGLSGFYDSNICLSMESPGKLKKSTVIQIKELTGNATISIERKGIDREEIKNHTRLVMASNDALQVEDDAFWDRCKIIPAVHSCPKSQRDPKLELKIGAERNAVATRAAYAAHELIANKFQFEESEYALALKKAWRYESRCSMDSFIADCIELTSEPNFVSTDQLYNVYLSDGYDEIGKTSFSMKLSSKLRGRVTKTKYQGANGYAGLRLKESDD